MLLQAQQTYLLRLARARIRKSSMGSTWSEPDHSLVDDALGQQRACFVTLHLDGKLRGCIGSLVARVPLLRAVSEAAHNASSNDPRFPPIAPNEVEHLDIEISVLSALQAMSWQNEEDLVAQLQPQRDGLLLQEGTRSGTFLPSVWATFPEPTNFWLNLKRKAGLADDHWSKTLTVRRYTTHSFSQRGCDVGRRH